VGPASLSVEPTLSLGVTESELSSLQATRARESERSSVILDIWTSWSGRSYHRFAALADAPWP
jgi:hypothetical protein